MRTIAVTEKSATTEAIACPIRVRVTHLEIAALETLLVAAPMAIPASMVDAFPPSVCTVITVIPVQ